MIERIRGHHRPVLEKIIRTPGKIPPLKLEPEASAGGFEHLDAGGNYFPTDAVSGNYCNAICFHVKGLNPPGHDHKVERSSLRFQSKHSSHVKSIRTLWNTV